MTIRRFGRFASVGSSPAPVEVSVAPNSSSDRPSPADRVPGLKGGRAGRVPGTGVVQEGDDDDDEREGDGDEKARAQAGAAVVGKQVREAAQQRVTGGGGVGDGSGDPGAD